MNRYLARVRDRALRPSTPGLRWITVLISVGLTFGVASARGWIVGVVAAVVYVGGALAMVRDPPRVSAWSKRHPVLDGAVLGLLAFLALAYITPWPLSICALVGLVALLIGAAMGARRGRRLAATN